MLPPFEDISRKFCPTGHIQLTQHFSCKVYSEMFVFSHQVAMYPPKSSGPTVVQERGGVLRDSPPTTNMKPSTPGCFSSSQAPPPQRPQGCKLQLQLKFRLRVSGVVGRQGPTCGPPSLSTWAQGARHFPVSCLPGEAAQPIYLPLPQ